MSIPFEIGNLSILGHEEPLVIADVRFWLPNHEIEASNEVTVRVRFLLDSMASLEELNEAALQEAKKSLQNALGIVGEKAAKELIEKYESMRDEQCRPLTDEEIKAQIAESLKNSSDV
ncbi:hypothetical protein [uncultured Cohaesibacter sp.]|uniref:hypothetical protein n=1 Tax=uncultured Cohaesibacter sp. TaxID=1002546 RepID=UPI0029C870AE|nr:hypothetical protein [uncultured Cohaesibacter sp.]